MIVVSAANPPKKKEHGPKKENRIWNIFWIVTNISIEPWSKKKSDGSKKSSSGIFQEFSQLVNTDKGEKTKDGEEKMGTFIKVQRAEFVEGNGGKRKESTVVSIDVV